MGVNPWAAGALILNYEGMVAKPVGEPEAQTVRNTIISDSLMSSDAPEGRALPTAMTSTSFRYSQPLARSCEQA